MGDGFLRDCLVIYIEKELAASISTDDIITAYDLAASRKAKFKFRYVILFWLRLVKHAIIILLYVTTTSSRGYQFYVALSIAPTYLKSCLRP